ncbi:LysR family transcriptional regulator [Bradyrhizobium sp. KBS0727]|nr:LysR family transcriptional regulator [Bradyrhizobium sp. KBS0725]QDW47410.1 LysR family transcriptional regulator [Bradyrhizobium sp. KBS0727]
MSPWRYRQYVDSIISMDIRTLRYFVAIAEEGTISKAALRLHVAQPALSLQLRKLEAELGSALLHRTARGVRVTASGAKLLTHARDIIQRFDAAREDIQGEAPEPAGSVVWGMSQSIAMMLGAPLVRQTLDEFPQIRLRLCESNTGHIPELLRSARLDLGVVFRLEEGHGLVARRVLEEDLYLVGPPGNLDGVDVALRDLAAMPMILPGRPHSLRELIADCARREGISFQIVAEVDAIPQIKELVATGLGYTILSHASIRPELEVGRLSARRIGSPSITRSVIFCRSADVPATRALQTVEETARQIVSRLVQSGNWLARLCSNES